MKRTQKTDFRKSFFVRCLGLVLGVFVLFPLVVRAETAYDTAWLRQFGTAGSEGATGVAVDSSGGIYVSWSMRHPVQRSYIRKFSASGDVVWEKALDMAYDGGNVGLAVENGGRYVYLIGFTDGIWGGYLAKFDASTGAQLWVKQLTTSTWIYPAGIVLDGSGNIFLSGTAGTMVEGFPYENGLFLAKYNPEGESVWVKQFAPGAYTAGGLALDTSGHLFITGRAVGSVEGDEVYSGYYDAFLATFSAATGGQLWVKQLGQKGMLPTFDYDVVSDLNGNVFAMFMNLASDDTNTNSMSKFRVDTGELLWTKVLGSPGLASHPTGAVLDAEGNVMISGWSYARPDNSDPIVHADSYIAKYSGATGDDVWIKLLESVDADDAAVAIALDTNGNVYASGYTYYAMEPGGAKGSSDAFLAKFTAVAPPNITDIIAKFDQRVAAGSITGSGPGNSANGRKKAIHNKLVAVEELLTTGDTVNACRMLRDVYEKMDGVSQPPDFVQGIGVAVVAADVLELISAQGCPDR